MLLFLALGEVLASTPQPAPIETYEVHADGGLIYNPLKREAAKTGQLDKYNDKPSQARILKLGALRLEVAIPEMASAYDVVPIPYVLHTEGADDYPIAVEAVAFEPEHEKNAPPLYDLTVPGKIDFKVEYLGSVTGVTDAKGKHNISRDYTDQPAAHYPNITRSPFVRSGTVEKGDFIWFKFRLTNTGNTILDQEGFGGGQLYPVLLKMDADGVFKEFAHLPNLYLRFAEAWYPGQSREMWMYFNPNLVEGEYKIRVRMTRRCYQSPDTGINFIDGPVVFAWDQPIRVAAKAEVTPVGPGERATTQSRSAMPFFIHTMEEFMTALDCYLRPIAAEGKSLKGTLHLQVAPWTSCVTVRLISGEGIKTAQIPLKVELESLSLRLPENLAMPVVGADGLAEPIFFTQTMADMRINVQSGPWPEEYIPADIKRMKDLGVNLLCTTDAPELYNDRFNPALNVFGDTTKFTLDVIRKERLPITAFMQYPFDRGTIGEIASWISGKDYKSMETVASGYGDASPFISVAEPRLAEANVETLKYHFTRWGDLFFQDADGVTPLSIEDTRGFLRDDINCRFPIGKGGVRAFQNWLKERYGNIDALNRAWGSNLGSFEEINPETGKTDPSGYKWGYYDQSNLFHDWNAPVEDYDIWRTELRAQNYRDVLAKAGEILPDPKIMCRTEGGNVLVGGIDPATPNAHYRHIFYSQRRVGAIAEVLEKSKTVRYQCDYSTVPYTPSELRDLVRASVKQGIIPAWLPTFNEMRDIVLNSRYGKNYQVDYNTTQPVNGYMMHVLTASFPWYRVMIEEGGIPGVLWQDYMCTGMVTDTQIKELQFYMGKLKEALAKLPAESRKPPVFSEEWKKKSRAMRSYDNAESIE